MSLFRLTEWYSNLIPSSSCLTVGSVIEERDQLIVGGEDGVVTILDPGCSERTEDIVLLQRPTNQSVIEILLGEFLPELRQVLAVLAPHSLTYYRIKYDSNDPSQLKMEEMFAHSLTEAAYNMCTIPAQSTTQILVQTIGCGLNLFQGDQCVFSRTPLPALHPGPVAYCYPSSSLVITNGGRIHSVKFSLLASVSNTGKKVTFDWIFNLGEHVIDMCMEDTPPIQPSIVVLCRTTVFCLTTGGTVRWQIRLECAASAMMVYNTKKESPSIRLCVATTTNTLLIFLDNRLLWNCQTDFLPIAVTLSSYSLVYQNVLSLLSVDGRITIGYLGTEPNLYKVPIDNRFIDYKAKIQEMKDLEACIKDSGSAGSYHKSTFALKYTIGELEKATVEHDVNGESPVCTITLQFEGTNGTQSVHINVRSSFTTSTKQIVINRPTDSTTVPIVFYIGNRIPTSTLVYLSAHCSGTQLTAFTTLRLPFNLLFCETSPDRNAKYKLTIDSNHPCIGLNNIFSEFQTENPSTIGFQVHGHSASVSIFTANKSNRYRIQTDCPSLLFTVVSELIDRLKRAQNGVILHANTPLEYVTPKLEDFIELETKSKSERQILEKRTKEVRSIQALILSKTKNTKPEPLDHIDLLFENAHEQLLEAINQLASTRDRMKEVEEELASLFDLLALVLKMDNLDTTLDGHIMSNTQQSLRDRLSWASKVADDPNRMIAVLCQHTQKALSQIREEDEKEDEFKSPYLEHGITDH